MADREIKGSKADAAPGDLYEKDGKIYRKYVGRSDIETKMQTSPFPGAVERKDGHAPEGSGDE